MLKENSKLSVLKVRGASGALCGNYGYLCTTLTLFWKKFRESNCFTNYIITKEITE